MTPFNNQKDINYSPSSVLLLCTLYNLFAHSSCTSLLILLFIKSTVYCPAHFNLYYYFYFILFSYLYLCIFSCVWFLYNCTLHGADLTYISLLVIFCIIVYVTNKTLNLETLLLLLLYQNTKWLTSSGKRWKQIEHLSRSFCSLLNGWQ